MKKNISVAFPILNGNEKKYVNDCIDTAWISSKGEYIDKFEKKFAKIVGTKYAIACSNGTVTLHLALLALDIKAGDEVIMPDLTYIATANAVQYCNATPVFVDIDRTTWNIDPKLIEKAITKKTKAIIVVHLYGNPVNMDAIMKIARKHKLFVIEDAAEAHGAKFKGKVVGSIGDIGSFSFFGNKIITTGEGGMVTTNSEKLYNKMKLLKGQGVDPEKRYWHIVVGYNYRMTNIQAAIGLAQAENFKWHFNQRKRVAKLYKKYFKPYIDLFEFQTEQPDSEHAYWMFSILLKDKVNIVRNDLILQLADKGIETRPVFYPMHIMPPYKHKGDYKFSDFVGGRGLNLPTHAKLTEDDIKFIVDNIVKLCNR